MAPLQYLLFFVGFQLVLAGIIPESTQKATKMCETYKVVCEPGWTCQMGYIPSASKQPTCRSNENCLVNSDAPINVEVYCVRRGLDLFNGHASGSTPFLSRLRQRSRSARATCVEMCSGDLDCSKDEICVSNGCGHICAKLPRELP